MSIIRDFLIHFIQKWLDFQFVSILYQNIFKKSIKFISNLISSTIFSMIQSLNCLFGSLNSKVHTRYSQYLVSLVDGSSSRKHFFIFSKPTVQME